MLGPPPPRSALPRILRSGLALDVLHFLILSLCLLVRATLQGIQLEHVTSDEAELVRLVDELGVANKETSKSSLVLPSVSKRVPEAMLHVPLRVRPRVVVQDDGEPVLQLLRHLRTPLHGPSDAALT